jgi:hypothetical protein
MEYLVVAAWLFAGVVGFFLARAAWGLSFGCKPVRVRTLVACFFVMWLPPLTILMAAVWTLEWWCEEKTQGRRPPGRLSRILNYEVANPCKWWAQRRSHF